MAVPTIHLIEEVQERIRERVPGRRQLVHFADGRAFIIVEGDVSDDGDWAMIVRVHELVDDLAMSGVHIVLGSVDE